MGNAYLNCPCRTRSHNERCAPAARNRLVSLGPSAFFSSVKANGCSVGAQSHRFPSREQTPWPYCVILTAVQGRKEKCRINPAATEIFPIFRVCPPTTMILG